MVLRQTEKGFMSCLNRFQTMLGKELRDMYANTKEAAKAPKTVVVRN